MVKNAEAQHNFEMLVFVMFQYTSYFLRVLSRLVKNELGEARTHDLPVKSRLLYQLSYQFVCGADLRLRLRLSVRQETSYLFTYSGMLLYLMILNLSLVVMIYKFIIKVVLQV